MSKDLFPENFFDQQYRMSLLQVYNWGTFSNLHRIHIARDGFLLVGPSGSGKSTLLDAISALLVPPQWRGFNAAARDGDKGRHDRNLALYVRGAWGAQTDGGSGEIVTQFLRPGSTWSAIALEYRNGVGKIITLIALFILRGQQQSSSEVQTHYLIAERAFDFKAELADFDLDIRRLKQKWADVYHTDKFKAYSDRFRLLMGIDSEMTLKLLHKTQSAKNLGDLNLFLREYMLDEPETFAVAERLVHEFTELDQAHQTVVTARQQVQLLTEARDKYQHLQSLELELGQLDELRLGVNGYLTQRQKKLFTDDINRLQIQILGLTAQEQQEQELLSQMQAYLRRLEIQHRDEGGGRIEDLQNDMQRAVQTKDERMVKRARVSDACKIIGCPLPDSPSRHAELLVEARSANESWQHFNESYEQQRDNLRDKHRETEREFTQVNLEVKSLRRQPSNIPSPVLELRRSLTTALGLAEIDLPFVGELIEVREEAATWRGAIERVLHGFALSLLVPERHYPAVSNFVNENHIASRLVYYRMIAATDAAYSTIGSNSLIHKIRVKPGDCLTWLEAELKRRFNYTCADSMGEFRKAERALTREGQVRHGKSHHEKDDRRAINDQKYWVLGFDNQEKLRLFEQRAQVLAEELATLQQKINRMQSDYQTQHKKTSAYQSIVNIVWHEMDVAAVLNQITAFEKEIAQLQQGNLRLQQIGEEITQQELAAKQKQSVLDKIRVDRGQAEEKCKDREKKLLELPLEITLTPYQQDGLDKRFHVYDSLTISNIQDVARKVERTLQDERESLLNARARQLSSIEKIFQQFKNQWPQDGADLDASIAAAADFMVKLSRIEHDGLPAHEERFFTLLREQSMENLAALSTHLSQARKDIIDRMETVNESLAGAQYNPGTYLKIEVIDRQLEPVKQFRAQIRQILSHAWNADREQTEQRFTILRELVAQLGGQDSEQQRWRQQALDVRLHVEFIAKENNAEGQEVEVHRSGAGKSGGQREKLTTTCLAAALCYQLSGRQSGSAPLYAPVVLDEAFSKADNEFTQEVMKIFINFGFQMIVATPLKSVMTLEPFIAGACFVSIADRKRSSALQIPYIYAEKRLDFPVSVT